MYTLNANGSCAVLSPADKPSTVSVEQQIRVLVVVGGDTYLRFRQSILGTDFHAVR